MLNDEILRIYGYERGPSFTGISQYDLEEPSNGPCWSTRAKVKKISALQAGISTTLTRCLPFHRPQLRKQAANRQDAYLPVYMKYGWRQGQPGFVT